MSSNKQILQLLVSLSLFFLSSCGRENITESTLLQPGLIGCVSSTPADSKQAERSDSVVQTIIQRSGKQIMTAVRWELDHYEAMPGMIVGTWPRGQRYFSQSRLNELHSKWGFNYILIPEIYEQDRFQMAQAAGFPLKNFMVQISLDYYKKNINAFKGNIYAYYCDEAADKNIPIDSMLLFRNQYASAVQFMISGYKRTSLLDQYVKMTDGVAYSSYTHWYQFMGYWVNFPVNVDQRPDWTDMQQRYGNKYSFTWIGAHADLAEYEVLLGHAKNLGLKNIWLYQYEDATDDKSDDNVSAFANFAWKSGYLKRVERKIYEEYIMQSDDQTSSGAPAKTGAWKLMSVKPSGVFRTVSPEEISKLMEK